MHRKHGRAIRLASSIAVVLVVAGLSTPAAVAAEQKAARPPAATWKGFDARTAGSAVGVSPRVASARIALARTLGSQGVIESDRTTGTLRFVGRLDGYLTGASSRPAAAVALGYVRANLAAFGLSGGDLKTLRLRRDYVDVAGTHHLSWTQWAGGLQLMGQGLSASVARDGRLVNVTGGPMHGLRAPAAGFRLSASAAISAARAGTGAAVTAPQARDTASRVLFPTGRGARAAWKTITFVSPSELDLSVVDDATADVLYRNNLTDSDTGVAKAWQFYPSDLVKKDADLAKIVTFPVYNGSALSGNNAHVYTDVNDDNVPNPQDEIPAISGTSWKGYAAPLDFTTSAQNCSPDRACTWDATTANSWKDNLAHNAVQVYRFLNFWHQHLKQFPIGFTEAAGNFQQKNGTGQGVGGDPVQGQSSDGANTGGGFPDLNHVNNANMSTPPDGTPPTMQMYLFEKFATLPDVVSGNGGDDAEVVYHEYTHGLSNRLVLYPDGNSGLDNQQAGSMGEAWSDWYAEDFLNASGFKPNPPGDGNLIMGQLTFGGDLRSQGVDCPVDASASDCPGQGGAGPGGYTYGDFGKIANRPEVHADGEIWLETLWDLRNALGSTETESLVTRAMELSPPSPSFLDMRNAIVQADVVLNGGANADTIWSTFATRGMGYFASSVGGSDLHPVEDFSTPPTCGVCYTISGTITDNVTGGPLQGVTVAVSGHNSGFDTDLVGTTNAHGFYRIRKVPPHLYPAVQMGGAGYEPLVVNNVNVTGDTVLNGSVTRDWASLAGGATLTSFTPPDYASFCGVNADGAFDLKLGNGWPSDSVSNGQSGVSGPRKATVRLPNPVDITSFGVASGGTCGDNATAGVKGFKFQTKTAGGGWQTSLKGEAQSDGVLRSYTATKATDNVVAVRFIMLSNYGQVDFMDVLEVTVHGST